MDHLEAFDRRFRLSPKVAVVFDDGTTYNYELRTMKVKLIIAALLLLLLVGCPAAIYSSEETLAITVVKTERVTSGSGDTLSSKYLVWTKSEVFQNSDSFLYLKFNSSDLYTKFEPGAKLTVRVVGWRIPFLSSYRNIVEVSK